MYRAFCLLGEHDSRRISYIYSHMNEYNFREVIKLIIKGLFNELIFNPENSIRLIITSKILHKIKLLF